jgi:rhamnulokinase
MGLWLLQECQRTWRSAGHDLDTGALLAAAAGVRPFAALVDPDDTTFLAPGDMTARIDGYCARTGQLPPGSPAEYARCIVESLAIAHRATVRDAMALSGRAVDVIHIVGGGSRSALLCQLTADACGLPVVAGPVEATAVGNVLVQARADGGPSDLAAMRALVAKAQPTRRYEPERSTAHRWDAAAARIGRA